MHLVGFLFNQAWLQHLVALHEEVPFEEESEVH